MFSSRKVTAEILPVWGCDEAENFSKAIVQSLGLKRAELQHDSSSSQNVPVAVAAIAMGAREVVVKRSKLQLKISFTFHTVPPSSPCIFILPSALNPGSIP